MEGGLCEAALTADLGRGILGDHGIRGELRVQDAAVCVGVHGQCIQQLPVLQHSGVLWAACLRHQGYHMLCGYHQGLDQGPCLAPLIRTQTPKCHAQKSQTYLPGA